ncbi:signal peptidase I [Candidatus Oleimmundimicrobium sp.]|uniref:signal peptidase I n=1 Tax=Candidatus Oleimmundimicrobium sp. TaxID=3060597 RepID=UPI002725D631|nr:signal peptidase I [Candidatus Oleimmundimicrobium sp.]MDO8886156.1 signal peptidase I [Candidatus Oleimmundimicrobium sp.]
MTEGKEAINEELFESEAPGKESKSSPFWAFIKETVFIVIAAFLFSFVIRLFIVEAFTIQQHSMDPTLHDSDRVLVSKFIYRLSDIEDGDIIILKSPMNKTDFVKRVVATEGQTIEIKEGVLVIDGKPVEESYIKNHDLSGLEPIEIPQDYVFVAGDNRPNSYDSRIFGPIPEDDVVGKVFFIYWPVDRIGLVN